MLTLQLHAALATAIQTYAQRFQGGRVQRTTALNAAGMLLGYPNHRMARYDLEAGDEPSVAEIILGQTYLTRAEQALHHVARQSNHTGLLTPVDAAAFAQEMLVSYDLALWQALGIDEEALWALVDPGHSTVVADARPWVCRALQRGLAYVLGQRYIGQFGMIDNQRFYTVIQRQQLADVNGSSPRTGRVRRGMEFSYQKLRPNIFYRARVDFSTPRLALPFLTPEMEADYDAYMMSLCDSVHAVYAQPSQQAATAWANLCGSSPVREGFTLISVAGDRLNFEWVPTR
ncbi:hypothetical protein [Deinococcus multiflagellatus]|uniref:Uncharacterized protein n=1 Tax=Deinococcus multiflagellatus TaxID=1656887 RepID=A0ABW1ZSS7_9DEIO|nr:hypothetical protein [Deinococcus multiflagellatus]MBZ9714917.1 hypothetical protein [Deinococcus multiflagellatus]